MFFKKSKPKAINPNPKARKERISDTMMQRISVMCKFQGNPAIRSFIYTGELNQEADPNNPDFPFYYQYKILKSEAGTLPDNYIEQLLKLQAIAIRQNVSMNDLLTHLLASTTGRKIAKINANSDAEKERLQQLYKQKLEQHKQQKQQQMQNLLTKSTDQDNTIQEILAQGKKTGNSEVTDPIKANIQNILGQQATAKSNTQDTMDPIKAQIQKIIADQKSNRQSNSHNKDTESAEDSEGGDIITTATSKPNAIYSSNESVQSTVSIAADDREAYAIEEVSDEIVTVTQDGKTTPESATEIADDQAASSATINFSQTAATSNAQLIDSIQQNQSQSNTITKNNKANTAIDDDPFSIDNLTAIIQNALANSDTQ